MDETQSTQAPEPDLSAAAALLGLPDDASQPDSSKDDTQPDGQTPADVALAVGGSAVDPLAEELFTEEALADPEKIKTARSAIIEERKKANDLRRAAHRAHSAAERREAKFKRDRDAVLQDKAQVAAVERALGTSMQDLESGDPDRFLNAVARLSKQSDAPGFWRRVAMKLANGGKLSEQAHTNLQEHPEIVAMRQQLQQVTQQLAQEQENKQLFQIEQAKDRNLKWAQDSADHRYTAALARERPDIVREGLANIMLEEAQRRGQPIDIGAACGILEEALQAQYEVSQRVNASATDQRGNAGSGPDAGREPSGANRKPETATSAPATVPASLNAAPATSTRPLTESEQRAQQLRELTASGFFEQFSL